MASAHDIDALLPQTQCGECGYPGCMPYAQALAAGGAPIDRCPPGGETTLRALGLLLHIDPQPYLHDLITRAPARAVIREEECIGCTKCIQACPVDAIVGSAQLMHSVIEVECTGCGLCVEPCPVDCIDLLPLAEPAYDRDRARRRFQARHIRFLRQAQQRQKKYREQRQMTSCADDQQKERDAKQAYILEALQRVKDKK